jgi:hypothetical protein
VTFEVLLHRLAAEFSPEVAEHFAGQLDEMLDRGRRTAAVLLLDEDFTEPLAFAILTVELLDGALELERDNAGSSVGADLYRHAADIAASAALTLAGHTPTPPPEPEPSRVW